MDAATSRRLIEELSHAGIELGQKLLGALVLWFVGRWLIRFVRRVVVRAMEHRKIDATLTGYAESVLGVLLSLVLVLAVLGVFGVQTTTLAAVLAAVGLAVGTAWGGLLQNFAAGAFLVVLKPFKRGDFVSIGGVLGTVQEIGLIAVTLNTPDNVRTFVENTKVFGDTIQNFTHNPFRRVERTVQLAHGTDHRQAIALLKARLPQIPNVLAEPAPEVVLLDFNMAGPVLAVRPYCAQANYWQVYIDTNEVIRDEFDSAGFDVPEQRVAYNADVKPRQIKGQTVNPAPAAGTRPTGRSAPPK